MTATAVPSFRARRTVRTNRSVVRIPAPLSAFELRSHIQSCKWLAGHAYSRWKATADQLAWAECIEWRQAAEQAGEVLSELLAPQEPAAAFFLAAGARDALALEGATA